MFKCFSLILFILSTAPLFAAGQCDSTKIASLRASAAKLDAPYITGVNNGISQLCSVPVAQRCNEPLIDQQVTRNHGLYNLYMHYYFGGVILTPEGKKLQPSNPKNKYQLKHTIRLSQGWIDAAADICPPIPPAANCTDFTFDQRGRVASLQVDTLPQNWDTRSYLSNLSQDKVYECFDDKFDFIFFVKNSSTFGSAFHMTVANNVQGIGKSVFNSGTSWGTGATGKLKGVMVFPALNMIAFGPTLHELAHQWGNSILPTYAPINIGTHQQPNYVIKASGNQTNAGGYGSHWGISSVFGQLGGFALDSLTENNNGSYSIAPYFGWNSNGGNGIPYAPLELYLMGLGESSIVPPTMVFSNITNFTYGFNNQQPMSFNGTPTTYNITNIQNLGGGARSPSYTNSQKQFRVLTLILTEAPLTQNQWDEADTQTDWFATVGSDSSFAGKLKLPNGTPINASQLNRLFNFSEATVGVGSLSVDSIANDKKK